MSHAANKRADSRNEGVGVMEEEGEIKAGRYKHKERRYVKKVKK